MQNDDWNRTTTVMRFLHGNFTLNPKTATTFYSQGFIGTIFSLIFGYQNLPFLTLLISVLNFYIFAKILIEHFKTKLIMANIISLIFFFTPLNVYSTIGFMTENYTMLFILLSIYFFLNYEKNSKFKDLAFFNISGVLAFFSKQNGIIVQVASIPYFLLKKKYKEAIIQIAVVSALFGYYYVLFPRTPEMESKDFVFENLKNIKYTYSLTYGILLVMTSYLLPLFLNLVYNTYFQQKIAKKNLVIFLGVSVFLFFLLNNLFEPGKIWIREYPYFQNTFERTGFLPRSLMGTKYQFIGNYKLYLFWDLVSKIVLALTLPCIFFYRKRLINIYSISIGGYLLLMVFVKVFYDRYLLPLFPLIILFILNIKNIKKERVFYFIALPFLLFNSFFSTQLALDFVISNNYIWSKSEELVNQQNVPPEKIRGGRAWGKFYDTTTYDLNQYQYLFSFDSPEKNPEMMESFEKIEEMKAGFPSSIFIDPKVYLYRKR